jgi:hypothetical protein
MSQQAPLHNPVHFATELPDDTPVAFVIGAFAVGAIDPMDHPYVCPAPPSSSHSLTPLSLADDRDDLDLRVLSERGGGDQQVVGRHREPLGYYLAELSKGRGRDDRTVMNEP